MKISSALHLGIICVFLLSACARSGANSQPAGSLTGELTVFAAASLTESFTEIAQAFERGNSGVKVVLNFAGSQQLAQQLAQGAPADVFASANQTQMQAAIEAGRVEAESVEILTYNHLVVVLPHDNPAQISKLADLAHPGLKIVLADGAVPVGRYSLAFFDAAAQEPALGEAFRTGTLENVVSYEQTVKAVLSKVLLGEADAGIVYTSDVTSVKDGQVQTLEIPAALNQVAEYPIAPVSSSAHPELAGRFMAFTLSPAGQDILARYGFLPPP